MVSRTSFYKSFKANEVNKPAVSAHFQPIDPMVFLDSCCLMTSTRIDNFRISKVKKRGLFFDHKPRS